MAAPGLVVSSHDPDRVAGLPAPRASAAAAERHRAAGRLAAAARSRPPPITQTLAQALGWADALALSQVLDQSWLPGVAPAPACQAVLQEAQAALVRIQQELADAMQGPAAGRRRRRTRRATPHASRLTACTFRNSSATAARVGQPARALAATLHS